MDSIVEYVYSIKEIPNQKHLGFVGLRIDLTPIGTDEENKTVIKCSYERTKNSVAIYTPIRNP